MVVSISRVKCVFGNHSNRENVESQEYTEEPEYYPHDEKYEDWQLYGEYGIYFEHKGLSKSRQFSIILDFN